MEPVYIHFNKLLFDEEKKFTLRFSDEEEIKKISFTKNKDYFITNMTCFIVHTVSENKKVIELSNICRELLKQNLFKHFPDYAWLDITNWLTFLRRWSVKRDTSKSYIYTKEYTFYDTVEKKYQKC